MSCATLIYKQSKVKENCLGSHQTLVYVFEESVTKVVNRNIKQVIQR